MGKLLARRYRAALIVKNRSIASVASEAGVCGSYVYDVLAARSPLSARMREALAAAVGPAGWAYACGETDTLPCPEGL